MLSTFCKWLVIQSAGTFAVICTIYNSPHALKLNFIISNQLASS